MSAAWIGLKYTEYDWRWESDGSVLGSWNDWYTSVTPDYPRWPKTGTCAYVYWNSGWANADCTLTKDFFCEIYLNNTTTLTQPVTDAISSTDTDAQTTTHSAALSTAPNQITTYLEESTSISAAIPTTSQQTTTNSKEPTSRSTAIQTTPQSITTDSREVVSSSASVQPITQQITTDSKEASTILATITTQDLQQTVPVSTASQETTSVPKEVSTYLEGYTIPEHISSESLYVAGDSEKLTKSTTKTATVSDQISTSPTQKSSILTTTNIPNTSSRDMQTNWTMTSTNNQQTTNVFQQSISFGQFLSQTHEHIFTSTEKVSEVLVRRAAEVSTNQTESPKADPADGVFLPEVDLTDKPWFNPEPVPSPVVESTEQFTQLVSTLDPETRNVMGHQIQNMLQECKWDGKICSPRNFSTVYDKLYGNCYTFNSGHNGSILQTQRSGSAYGLSMIIYIEQSEYVAALSPSAGIRVVIHHPDDTPSPSEEGVEISPGKETSIRLSTVKYLKIEPPFNDCVKEKKYDASRYTRKACLHECFQSLLMEECGCVDSTLPYDEGASTCTDQDNLCVASIRSDFTENNTCACRDPCRGEIYHSALSTNDWPGHITQKNLLTKLMVESPELYNKLNTSDAIKKNFIKLTIYNADVQYKEIVEDPVYTTTKLFADIGGQVGLWVGVSLLSFIECLDVILRLILHASGRSIDAENGSKYDDIDDIINRRMKIIEQEVRSMKGMPEVQ